MDPELLEAIRRNSGIGLSADGRWLYRGRPVENERVQQMFHEGLAVTDDGEVTLTVGHMWCYVEAEGVARFVDGLRIDGDALMLRLRDGHTVAARRPVLAVDPAERFYVWSDPSSGPAILTRQAHQQLAGLLDADADTPTLRLGDTALPLRFLQAAPAPDGSPPGS